MKITHLKISWPIKLVLAGCVVLVAFALLRGQLQNITFAMVIDAIHSTPKKYILWSMIATFVSFAAMGCNEIVATKTLENRPLAWKTPALAGMAGYAFGNTLGFPALTVSAWRYRVYSPAGLNIKDITGITAVAFMGIILGYVGLASFYALLSSDSSSAIFTQTQSKFYVGAFGFVLLVLFFIWTGTKRRKIGLKQWTFFLPGAKLSGLLLIFGLIDLFAAMFAAYILLPQGMIGLTEFMIFYVGAVLFGIASQAPGGIGVFEAGIIAALAAQGRADVVAALLLFRLIYNIMPFCLACLALAYKMQSDR